MTVPMTGAGPSWPHSSPPPPAPVPSSAAAQVEAGVVTGIVVTFDRNVVSGGDPGLWSATAVTDFGSAVASGAAVNLTVDFGTAAQGEPVVVGYAGGDVFGDPDGVPVAAFANFPVSNP